MSATQALPPGGFYIVSAYYHSSERTYSFGPFKSEAVLRRFIEADNNVDERGSEKHTDWDVLYINPDYRYNTGNECSTYNL